MWISFTVWAKVSQLSYSFNRDGGLSVFGHSIMQRMEKIGMAVNVSHSDDRTTLDALETEIKPVASRMRRVAL